MVLAFYSSRFIKWKCESKPISTWTAVTVYNGKLYNGTAWVAYSGGGTPGNVYNAVASSDIKSNSNLYTINTTFYDYYTDTEVANGWRTSTYQNSHGDWEPYTKLNKALADYAKAYNVKRPLYFGNFFDISATGLTIHLVSAVIINQL